MIRREDGDGVRDRREWAIRRYVGSGREPPRRIWDIVLTNRRKGVSIVTRSIRTTMRWYDYLMAGLYDYMKCTEGGAAVVEEAAAVEVEARR